MNKTGIILLTALAILIIPVFSATCTDSDEGPVDPSYPKEFISKPGNTTVAKTVLSDYCMREKNGVKIKEGEWIKEYMCTGNLAVGKDYKCSDYGYEKCISDKGLAACVKTGQTTVAAPVAKPVNTTVAKKPKVKLQPQCGDKQIQQDRGEQCDPPGRLCVDPDGFAGTCEKDCKCKAYKKGETTAPEVIKSIEDKAEATEVKTETPKEEMAEKSAEKKEVKEEQKPADKQETGFFAKIFSWLSKTFS